MAIRFIDTNFFKSPFVRGLEGSMKSLYTFIICDCSGAGIWAADFEVASLYTGLKLDYSKFDSNFISKGKAIDLGNGRYFFPDFIDHQYPKGLSTHNPAHKNVILELSKYQLIIESDEGTWKVLQRPFQGSQVTVKDTVMVKDNEKVKESRSKIFKKPELFEVEQYMDSRGHKDKAEAFYDHYESNGWKVSSNSMVDWKAACRNWIRNNHKYNNGTTKNRAKPLPIKGGGFDENGNRIDISGEEFTLAILRDIHKNDPKPGNTGSDQNLLQP